MNEAQFRTPKKVIGAEICEWYCALRLRNYRNGNNSPRSYRSDTPNRQNGKHFLVAEVNERVSAESVQRSDIAGTLRNVYNEWRRHIGSGLESELKTSMLSVLPATQICNSTQRIDASLFLTEAKLGTELFAGDPRSPPRFLRPRSKKD